MSRYTVKTSEYAVGGIIIRDGEHPIWMSVHDKNMLLSIATVLDNETAPLHAEIERLKAENAKLKAMIAEAMNGLDDLSEYEYDWLSPADCWKLYEKLRDMQESEADDA